MLPSAIGRSEPGTAAAKLNDEQQSTVVDLLRKISQPLMIRETGTGHVGLEAWSAATLDPPCVGLVAGCNPRQLGDPSFCRDHQLDFPYIGGSMAKGISSVTMVKALGQAGLLGFFGAAGLSLDQVEEAINQLQGLASPIPYGFNLIHSPNEPELEKKLVKLYLRRQVRLIEASAFLALTLPVVRFRTQGIHRNGAGHIVAPNGIIAKVSREEVAARFMAPPPEKLLRQLVQEGHLSEEQAGLAAQIPVARDITVEADSGGHTDNRPALALFPTIQAQAQRIQIEQGYAEPLRVGLGGGIATPAAAAAAFAMGAAYLVTGTVNQACVESGTCDEVRQMLAETRQADITMAPSGDMFEMGVKVQVVKRGTMFAIRAHKLYELYKQYDSVEALPAAERDKLEKTFFLAPLNTIWEETRSYFAERDPRQVEKAERDPKHKLALVFRWYLGQSPVWANRGEAGRKIDYQIWCGPAMGAFNEWVRGSWLETPANRKVVDVAYNILFGAALLKRTADLRQQVSGWTMNDNLTAPVRIEQIKECLR